MCPDMDPTATSQPHANRSLTAERARELFSYNPEVGVLLWREVPESTFVRKPGDVAGSLSQGYRRVEVDGVAYMAHRVVWLMVHGAFPDQQIDHINRDRADNRISNLRVVDNYTNAQNRSVYRTSKTGVPGVSFNSRQQQWGARATINRVRVHLGWFATLERAIAARTGVAA